MIKGNHMNELEKYQFEVLKRYVLEPDWLDQLTLQYDWSRQEREIFKNILNKFNDTEQLTYTKFEIELRENFNLDFTDVECIYQILLQNSDYKFIKTIHR